MKKKQHFIISIAILIVAVLIMLAMSQLKKPAPKKSPIDTTPVVDVQPVELNLYQYQVHSQGVVAPLSETQIKTEVSGKVIRYNSKFQPGRFIKKGELLLQLEQADYLTAVKAAEANLARAQAAYEEEKARRQVALNDWKRSGNVGEAPKLGLREPQIARELANVRSAEAELERARRNLERTRIEAPYDGLIKSRTIDIGQYVNLGSPLGIILATDTAEVRLPISLADYSKLGLSHQHSELETTALKTAVKAKLQLKTAEFEFSWDAEIIRDEGIIDERNRMIYLVAQVKDPFLLQSNATPESKPRPKPNDTVLRFGAFVQATLYGQKMYDVIQLKKTALVDQSYVYMVTDEFTLKKKAVTIMGSDKNNWFVKADLQQGDLVVTTTLPQALPGMKVSIKSKDQEQTEAQP